MPEPRRSIPAPNQPWHDLDQGHALDLEPERPAETEARQAVRLRAAMLPTAELVEQYRRDAGFHHLVDSLTAWLPTWVQASAVACAIADERQRADLELAYRFMPPRGGMTHDELVAALARRGLPTATAKGEPLTTGDAAAVLAFADELRARGPAPALQEDGHRHDSETCRRKHSIPRAAISENPCGDGRGRTCRCKCHVTPHPFTPDLTLADVCTTCEERFPMDHEIHQHRYVVDDDGAACCPLPVDHPTHAVTVVTSGDSDGEDTPT